MFPQDRLRIWTTDIDFLVHTPIQWNPSIKATPLGKEILASIERCPYLSGYEGGRG